MAYQSSAFYLFNCDNTYNLEIVEGFLLEVEKKYGFKVTVDRHYFKLQQMTDLCERTLPQLVTDFAIFAVHANESRLSINEDNAGIGYAKIYRALLEKTDNKVLIVIGGDSNYRDEDEKARSVISRWAKRKVASQFDEEYLDGRKSFIFSWNEKHRPIHEQAMRHFLDPSKRGFKFEYTPPRPLPKPIPPVIPQHLSKPKTPVATFAGRNVRQESSLVEGNTEIFIQDNEQDTYRAISSVISGRSAGVEIETVFMETKVRYGEISYNAKDVLQRKGGWRPSERQVSIVMEDLKPYAVRTVKFFRTGDDPAVKFSYDKLEPSDPLKECCVVCVCGVLEDYRERSIEEFNKKSRCQKCMFTCCCCFCVLLFLCCGMFKECMVTCYLALVRCLGSLWGWCTDRFRGR